VASASPNRRRHKVAPYLLRGRTISLLQGTRRFTGVATGIDDEGSLLIRTDAGRPLRFRAGEVTLEKNQAERV
jgi:BirA family biotin operon repressor/biotin-[acetyl-CoA-carboxylase] ligase